MQPVIDLFAFAMFVMMIVLLFRPVRAALADYTAQRRAGKNPVFRAESAGLQGKTQCWN